jgi:hypothetical protein
MKHKIVWIILLFLAACIPQPQATRGPNIPVTSPPGGAIPTSEPILNPVTPKPGDENLARGNVYINEASLVIRESYPPQVSLSIRGDLPTPCNMLRVKIDPPDQENKIIAEAYSLVDPNKVCIQVLEPFQEYIDLGAFSPGHYSVWVNDERVGEFDT